MSSVGVSGSVALAPQSDVLGDGDVVEVFVESTWRGQIQKFEREQQCDKMQTVDKACSAKNTQVASCQTETAKVRALNADASLPPGFDRFLHSVYPMVSAQLESNVSSRAFDDFLVSWEEERDACDSLFVLTHDNAINELESEGAGGDEKSKGGKGSSKRRDRAEVPEPLPGGAAVLAVSWSCNGSVVAASYGRSDHSGWCAHQSSTLAFWNIARRQIAMNRPDFSIDTECCCMCLAYHPERPTVLAGGMFNGEVRLWDTSLLDREEATAAATSTSASNAASADGDASASGAAAPSSTDSSSSGLLARSSVEDLLHKEPVTKLEWVRDTHTRSWLLASIAGDGKVLLWNSDDINSSLRYPIEGYLLSPSAAWSGHGSRPGQSQPQDRGGKKGVQVLGGASVSFEIGLSLDLSAHAGAGGVAGPRQRRLVAATEAGGLLALSSGYLTNLRRGGHVKEGTSRWSRDALRLVDNAEADKRYKVKQDIERFFKTRATSTAASAASDAIELATIFESGVAASALYPSSSAIRMSYESHAGQVHMATFNPHESASTLFLTASADGRAKLFHAAQPRPLLTLDSGGESLYSAAWSSARPLVFALATSSGKVLLYDLLQSMLAPALVLEPVAATGTDARTAPGGSKKPRGGDRERERERLAITSLAWNATEPSLLSCADLRGRVHIWQLPARYAQLQPGEKRLAEQMARLHSQ